MAPPVSQRLSPKLYLMLNQRQFRLMPDRRRLQPFQQVVADLTIPGTSGAIAVLCPEEPGEVADAAFSAAEDSRPAGFPVPSRLQYLRMDVRSSALGVVRCASTEIASVRMNQA